MSASSGAILQYLRDGDEFVSFFFVASEQVVGGDDGLGAVCAHLLVAAVVEQDHVASTNARGHFSFDHSCGRGIPIVARYTPHYWLKAKFACQAKDGWAAASERRTEEIGMSADGFQDGGAALGEFTTDLGFGFDDEQRMSEGVVADEVAGSGDFAGDFGALLNVAADEEKSRSNIVAGEDVEQSEGMGVVGAVVVC